MLTNILKCSTGLDAVNVYNSIFTLRSELGTFNESLIPFDGGDSY